MAERLGGEAEARGMLIPAALTPAAQSPAAQTPAGESFVHFVEMRERALQRTAWLLTGDWALAEDLVQTALVRSWPRWDRIRRRDDPEIYVRRVIINTWATWSRRRWRAERASEVTPDTAAPGDVAADVAVRIAVRSALGSLTDRQRAVLVLRIFDDLSEAVALVAGLGAIVSARAMSLGRGSGPAGGTLTAGVPRYYVESGFQAHGRQVADVRATATGAITATIRSPWPGRQVSFAAIAAASKETFILVGQKEASDGTVIGSRIYRFRVTGTGRIVATHSCGAACSAAWPSAGWPPRPTAPSWPSASRQARARVIPPSRRSS